MELQPLDKLAETIYNRIVNPPVKDETPLEIKGHIVSILSWYLDDVFRTITNINQTSLNRVDRGQRLIDLEEKYGIPKTHNIIGR